MPVNARRAIRCNHRRRKVCREARPESVRARLTTAGNFQGDTTMRYEVTLDDGWKLRVNAQSPQGAIAKAEASPMSKGAKVSSVKQCEDIPNEHQ